MRRQAPNAGSIAMYELLGQTGLVDFPPLLALDRWRAAGQRVCLLTIVEIDGKSPRTVGAQMAVSAEGQFCGYLTGGCLEAELCAKSVVAMGEGRNVLVRYGKGSPYIDLKLPCGSGIDVYFDQGVADDVLRGALEMRARRVPFAWETDLASGRSHLRAFGGDDRLPQQAGQNEGVFTRIHQPPLQVNIIGAGLASVQLATLLRAAGIGFSLLATDGLTERAAAELGIPALPASLETLNACPADPWTAWVILSHDHERETPLLVDILNRDGFYIGAMGSQTTNRNRLAMLAEAGFAEEALARITAPAGAVRMAKSATEMAIGVMAEILDRARGGGLVT
ncbi:XdhC family protein [Arsenicitalea aurantiaca]|uniref:XdhC family protein n=1 Tax=Arsenicitalea aurantiaca TaxID=1783274 RepID=UPI0013153332|nr:XdhC family protein [Arsenicitalea aurantiaca]